MSFRTIVIKSRCKLEYSLNFLVYRGEKEVKINLNEISTLMIQSEQVSITSALLIQLIKAKVKVIICDEFHNPQSELIPYYGCYNVREKINAQMAIPVELAEQVWKEIIEQKIEQQAMNLAFVKNDNYSKLMEYKSQIVSGDKTNREGHAAKVYFNSLFGNSFSREQDNEINAFLNYGYSILLSGINREIKNTGYLTEIGIHHIGNTNPFNLSCDLMEPLRPLVDYYVITKKVDMSNFRSQYINMLSESVVCDRKKMILDNAIRQYVASVLSALMSKDPSPITFIKYERI